ncbi:hypothetical protein RJ640_014008 [Escallonia rubra]|uniref:AMP-dependent synthetase/ligase domain-containing protein n=1 Tax=Escallonia rubra TaxID=112253 RepID=A0AA88RLM9_9ASTE|nr:hypothetical protein RJ640_014008 [Escallonia rubra]
MEGRNLLRLLFLLFIAAALLLVTLLNLPYPTPNAASLLDCTADTPWCTSRNRFQPKNPKNLPSNEEEGGGDEQEEEETEERERETERVRDMEGRNLLRLLFLLFIAAALLLVTLLNLPYPTPNAASLLDCTADTPWCTSRNRFQPKNPKTGPASGSCSSPSPTRRPPSSCSGCPRAGWGAQLANPHLSCSVNNYSGNFPSVEMGDNACSDCIEVNPVHITDLSDAKKLNSGMDNPELFNRIAEVFCSHSAIRFAILLWGEKSCLASQVMEGLPIYSYKEIIDLGSASRKVLLHSHSARKQYVYEAISSDDIATLLYTSGTSGNPKGVVLTHTNLLHQLLSSSAEVPKNGSEWGSSMITRFLLVENYHMAFGSYYLINNFWDIVPAEPGDRFLSMLPTWHAYERSCEYFIFTHGVEQVYTTVKNLKEDLRRYQPHYMISVPLVYQTLYSFPRVYCCGVTVLAGVMVLSSC